MEGENAEDLRTSYVYYPADPKAILDDLFRLMQKILLCYNKIIDKLEDSIENSNTGNFLDQSRIIEDKCADFFQFLVESARVVPLENVQNIVAAAYFCIHKFTRYPEFLKKCSDENWRASFKFFSMIGDYLCRE